MGEVVVRAGRREESPSLRREWTRAFVVMLVLLLATGGCTIFGVRHLVSRLSGVATQRDRETQAVAGLRISMVDHEQLGHLLLSGKPVDRADFVRRQAQIGARFGVVERIFPEADGSRLILERTQEDWQKGLMDAGLWGSEVMAITRPRLQENPIFGAASDASYGMLDDLDAPSLRAMYAGLADSRRLERFLIIFLGALFAVATAVTWQFRRRMSRDLFAPVDSLRHSMTRFRSGDLDHQILIARNDELGELASAFNSMAEALRESHRTLTQRATHDVLTGLANRAALTEHLRAAFAGDSAASCGSLLFIDVDDFKDVNDSLGHEAGDVLLTQLVGRLTGCVGPQDLVSRLGGDEFAIVVAESDGLSHGSEVAERVLTALEQPVRISGTQVMVSVSIGVALRRSETADPAELLRQADFAMYMAKGGGKSRFQVFDPQMHDSMVGRSALKADLVHAVTDDQLRLHYQPVVDLRSGLIVGVEALVRWQHPTLGLLGPDDFIPLAEESGDIQTLGCWVLQTALEQLAHWRETVVGRAELWVSVNLSPFQLPSTQSLAQIQQLLTGRDVPAQAVILEVTEAALAADVQGAVAALNTLRSCGARIAVDDFGTGFSSLSTLARLPIDIVKIDRSLVSGQGEDIPSVPMLESILGLADKPGLVIIAEGIESPEQLAALRRLGCPFGQGFLLARPMEPQQLAALLSAGALPVVAPAAGGVGDQAAASRV